MPSTAETLSRVQLFASLGPADFMAVAARFREDRFERDSTIFHEGDPAARFWVVKEGQVKIVKYGEGGREIVIEVIPPSDVFGGATMLMSANPATAKALSDVATLSLSVDEYKKLLHDYPDVAVCVIQQVGARMRGVIQGRAMAGERVERRIGHMLLKLADKFGEETRGDGRLIGVSLTRQDIADLADTTVETAIRVMSRFSKAGVVKTLRGGYVMILNREELHRIADGK